MRVFVTGASGHIASAVVPELTGAGHEVVGLARSDASADAVAALGAEVLRGDLDDLAGLRKAAAAADGVLHFAFKHDAMRSGDFAGAVASDLSVTEAIGAELEGSGKPFVAMGGTMMVAGAGITGRPATEEDAADAGPRVDAENTLVAMAERGVRSSVVRLSPVVHGPLDHHGFIPTLIALAREKGFSGYVGDGANRWPAVQTLDAARLCLLALEKAPAGSRLHAVADEGVPFREIAEAIGRRLDLPVRSVAAEDAAGHFGFLGALVQTDNHTSNARTRKLLGWEPVHPGLLDDLAEGHYFD
ncbi:NAD-dependent epimerase/dehydratase family protein [Streptomyces sp. DW26H14]|uniref:NAD-dependent epimerase/dehydratase family protein n=1 Tax=Streptomyces sp. DW26H14 TaxID=3435395 RepID=UPI00403E181E